MEVLYHTHPLSVLASSKRAANTDTHTHTHRTQDTPAGREVLDHGQARAGVIVLHVSVDGPAQAHDVLQDEGGDDGDTVINKDVLSVAPAMMPRKKQAAGRKLNVLGHGSICLQNISTARLQGGISNSRSNNLVKLRRCSERSA